ncbi:hypothetical protein [Paenibacillus sp. OK003]|uniref:hypothetical protein n=1 Tax=Paenibacillus sp. OK003 TaxID=1884380 RepID=UPI000B826DF3|nr:hypothetical protein [Paenibacillus sp. OK003]
MVVDIGNSGLLKVQRQRRCVRREIYISNSINAFVLTYIFEYYADESDHERVEWEERLEFLDIKQTTGIAGVDRNMHVFVEFND